MDIHRIKPVHGWREFFGEIGIIVLGVLIALSAEQLVEAIHWRHRVEAARETLTVDLADKKWIAREREAASYCLSRRLDALAEAITLATKTHRLPAIATFVGPPNRYWTIDSWNSVVADGTASHFPRERLLSLSRIANFAQTVGDLNHEESRLWNSFKAVAGPGRPIDDAELGHLIELLQNAGADSARMRRVATQIQHIVDDSGLPIDRMYREVVQVDGKPDHGRARHDCRYDAGEIPGHYGYTSPLREALEGRLNLPR